jgi:hypothetical protein
MREQSIVQRMKQEARSAKRAAPPFRFDIRGASREVEKLGEKVYKQETSSHDSSAFWFNLAEEIKRARYITQEEVKTLTARFPFLTRYAR